MKAGPKKSPKKQSVETRSKIHEIAKKRFKIAEDAERDIRLQALDDHKFAAGDQWDTKAKADRELDGRPTLVINRLTGSIHQVVNDQKQNPVSIKVSPVDDGADEKTAKIHQGLIRHIQYSSNADVAYSRGFNCAVRGGFGYWRVTTEFCDPFSFDQDIKIKSIRNPFNVYLDPFYQEPDGSDANWGFIFEDLSHDDYREKYPKSKLTSMREWRSIGDSESPWITDETVRVAEYFFKEYERKPIVLLSDGSVVEKDKLGLLPEGLAIVDERETTITTIKWCKIDAVEILEETIWPGKWIPIIPVLGEELDIDGKRILESLVRHAKDPQRMYNYWASAETEAIALAPRAPFIGAEGQFEGYEELWATANRRNHAFLQYKPVTIAGQLAPPPQRNAFEPAVSAISQARLLSGDDLKSTTGIYDAALGNRSNETSGRAIERRTNQAQTSNYHFFDNFQKSIRHTGRILVDLIPKIYDTARTVRIIGEEGNEEIIRIYEEFVHNGETVTYDLGAGKYDVTISTGPSFETKRQEAVASMIDLSRANPQLAQIAGDLMVKNMDWPGKDEIAERLRKVLPPGLSEDKEKKPIPPHIQAQMNQMSQMIEALTEQLNEKTKVVESKLLEIESKERIAMAELQTKAEIELAKMGSQEALALLQHEIQEIQSRLEMLRFDEPIEHINQNQFQDLEAGTGPEMGQMPIQQQPTLTGELPPGEIME